MNIAQDNALEKVYRPGDVEVALARNWACRKREQATHDPRPTFSMVIPPPNVTGVLHIGHALNVTLQDTLVRFKRMNGYDVLWVPGTDHAGIATQNVVERQLTQEGKDWRALGRDGFIRRVWEWRATSGGTIVTQLKRLGALCDWEYERFTMDKGCSRAVREVFVKLYQEGLIYKDKRLINWCSHCQTALSDIEVTHKETNGHLYKIAYPLAGEDGEIVVATTRPETLLGDTAVAVHPEDARYVALIGKRLRLPLTESQIPIIADAAIDPAFGTGAVKVTPGHDFNDEAIGKRHRLPVENVLTPDGKLAVTTRTGPYAGENMAKARDRIVADLKTASLLRGVEAHAHAVGVCYRCATVVEPYLSEQWFVRMNDPKNSLAKVAMEAVRRGDIHLIPKEWEANFFGWMEDIQDWCISRQIWWGHPIPAWYCGGNDKGMCLPSCKGPIVSVGQPDACPVCGSTHLIQDTDVLDTWFSSALWPFATLGWPTDGDGASEVWLRRFYPTSTLVTSHDILFFWVARMIMMGLYCMKEIPFKDVYIHALVRDKEGQKMSKSRGNVIDPLSVIDRYGADALRFTLLAMASPGRNIQLTEERIEGYRNFANKLWNAARFIQMQPAPQAISPAVAADASPADEWITGRLNQTVHAVHEAMNAYRFDEAAAAVYQFVWHQFCDWYLECVKVGTPTKTQETLLKTFQAILKMMHPFMPFITEHLWGIFGAAQYGQVSLVDAPYPNAVPVDGQASDAFETMMIATVSSIRNLRGEMQIAPSERLECEIYLHNAVAKERYTRYLPYICALARVSIRTIEVGRAAVPKGSTAVSTIPIKDGEMDVILSESYLVAQADRLSKALGKLKTERDRIEAKWDNPLFMERAPESVRAALTTDLDALKKKEAVLCADLARVNGALKR